MFRVRQRPGRLALAHHKSAKKRARQALNRRARNRHARSRLRGAVKVVRSNVAAGNSESAEPALRQAERLIRKAASKGVVSKRWASRQVARLSRRVRSTSD